MANASVEISWVASAGDNSVKVFAHCIRQETLAISGTTATMAAAISASDIGNSSAKEVLARIVTDDTGCYVARGSTPDPTATAQSADNSATTSARRWIPAGGELIMKLSLGQKIAVHS